MEINGQPDNWDINHFLGFDKVGDCLSDIGDITSVFSHIENEKLILHATDKLSFVLGGTGNVDVQFHFIRQDWS